MSSLWLFLKYDTWYDNYAKNCSLKTNAEWNAAGYPNVPIGVTYLTIGFVSELIYIPFLIAMLQKEIISYSCYKIMFLLGFFDMIAIPFDAIIPGILSIYGEHFCTKPFFFYVCGYFTLGMYHAVTATCIVLAIDRFFVILFPAIGKKLFGGKRIYIWLILPFIYAAVFTGPQSPPLFNNSHHSFHYDPFIGVQGFEGNKEFYKHGILIINSALTVSILGSVYTTLCIVLYLKPKNLPTITKLQKVMLWQSIAICFEMYIVAIVYVGNQYVPVPNFLTKIEHIALICIHADTPFVYLFLNATLRKKFFGVMKDYLVKSGKTYKHRMLEYATSIYSTSFHQRVQPANSGMTTEQNGLSLNNMRSS